MTSATRFQVTVNEGNDFVVSSERKAVVQGQTNRFIECQHLRIDTIMNNAYPAF